MATHEHETGSGPRWWLPVPLLLLFLVLPTLIELLLIASDQGWGVPPRLRPLAYQYGAFWSGLLDNWRPNYTAQPWLMFLTYSFLHSGWWHLAGNMVALVYLMQLNETWLRGWWFLALYLLSAIGGGIGFALLGDALNPMVGASGALFGLAGAWRFQEWRAVAPGRARWLMILRDVAFLSAMNLIMWVLENGALAWESHAGGFAAGVAVMAVIVRIQRLPPPDAEPLS